jgi:hypothetical protein
LIPREKERGKGDEEERDGVPTIGPAPSEREERSVQLRQYKVLRYRRGFPHAPGKDLQPCDRLSPK